MGALSGNQGDVLHPAMSSSPRPITVIDVRALEQWPAKLPFAGQRFTLLLVLDERDPRADKCTAWGVFAERVIEQGLAYFCAWGPHCELAHDLMDETLVARELLDGQPEAFLMTTWHGNEPLAEAIWFARRVIAES